MTETEVAKLVNLLIGTWPTGPRGFVWRDTIANFNYEIADLTYRELRNHNERMTIAEYVAAYQRHIERRNEQIAREATSDTPPDEELISLDEYLERLQRRANDGDTLARTELAAWRRHRKTG